MDKLSSDYNFDKLLNKNKSSLIHSAAIGIKNDNEKAWDVITFLIKNKKNGSVYKK